MLRLLPLIPVTEQEITNHHMANLLTQIFLPSTGPNVDTIGLGVTAIPKEGILKGQQ